MYKNTAIITGYHGLRAYAPLPGHTASSNRRKTGLLWRERQSSREKQRPGEARTESRYDTRCYFNVRSKPDMSQLNLPHGTDN